MLCIYVCVCTRMHISYRHCHCTFTVEFSCLHLLDGSSLALYILTCNIFNHFHELKVPKIIFHPFSTFSYIFPLILSRFLQLGLLSTLYSTIINHMHMSALVEFSLLNTTFDSFHTPSIRESGEFQTQPIMQSFMLTTKVIQWSILI